MICILNHEEYKNFMNFFKSTRRSTKEYFQWLRFYSDIGSQTEILKNLELPDGRVVIDEHEIATLVTEKYKKLFRDRGIKRK